MERVEPTEASVIKAHARHKKQTLLAFLSLSFAILKEDPFHFQLV